MEYVFKVLKIVIYYIASINDEVDFDRVSFPQHFEVLAGG